jgi:hypothetical protein
MEVFVYFYYTIFNDLTMKRRNNLDILGIVNEFINNNKSNEKLAIDIINLLNKGYSLQSISNKYNMSTEKVDEIIINENYIFNKSHQMWEKDTQTMPTSKTTPSNDSKKEIKNLESANISNVTNELKINLDTIINQLNNGNEFNDVCKLYNITSVNLQVLLQKNNYTYFSFMNNWSKMSSKELCEHIVSKLNHGVTLFDLSGQYVKSNKDRLNFVSKTEQLLKSHNYTYHLSTKTWIKDETTINNSTISKTILDQLPLIVENLNTGLPLKEVADRYKMLPSNLRLELKKNDYRYDPLFKIWTKYSRYQLIKNIVLDLQESKISIEQLTKKGLNIKVLEIEFKRNGFHNIINLFSDASMDNTSHVSINSSPSKEKELIEVHFNSKVEHADLTESIPAERFEAKHLNPNLSTKGIPPENKSDLFNSEEVTKLKEIISYWEKKKEEELSIGNDSVELDILIKSSLLIRLTNASETEGLSRSRLIEKALEEYFKNK